MVCGLVVTGLNRTPYISENKEINTLIEGLCISLYIYSRKSQMTSALQMFQLARTVPKAGAVQANSISEFIVFHAFIQSLALS